MTSKLPEESFGPTVAERKPTVYLDVPVDQVKGLELGEKLTVTFRGKVVGMSVSKSGKMSRAHVDIEDPSVAVKRNSSQMEDFDEELD